MIAIRAAELRDAGAIAALYAPHVNESIVSFEAKAPGAKTMARRMEGEDGLYPWIVATEGKGADAKLLGYAYATRFRERPAYRWAVETTVYVADEAQRQGVGRLLYDALLDTLRAQGFTQAFGVIALPNDGSIRLHEQVGFRRAGLFREVGYKRGQWIDVGYWQAQLHQSDLPPVEPRRFAEVGLVRD